MAHPITRELALKNLPPCTYPTFVRICEKYLQRNEGIYHSAYCTTTKLFWSKDAQEWITLNSLGVFTVTDFRIVLGTFLWGQYDSVAYAKGDRQKTSEWIFGSNRTWQWILPQPPTNLPDLNKLGREKWGAKIHETFEEMPLFYQEKISPREFHVYHKGQPIDLFVLTITYDKGKDDHYDVAFLYDDGKRIYDLLQEALQNRGRLFKSQQEQPTMAMTTPALDAVELLSKLKLMLEQGLISEEEFQAKKSHILSRM